MLRKLRFALDHRATPRHLSGYLDGELRVGRRAQVERHVHDCPECRAALAALRALLSRIRGLPPPTDIPAAAQIASAVRIRLHEPPTHR